MIRTTHQDFVLNPIPGRGDSGGAISSFNASNRLRIPSSCISIFRSSSASLAASLTCAETISRNRTKARMIAMWTSTARGLCSTPESIETPSCVKTNGNFRRPPLPFFDVADCNIKPRNSSLLSSNIKSSGNRFSLRRTCWLRRAVVTPYRTAKSESSKTRRPRIKKMRLPISSLGTKEPSIAIPTCTNESSIWFPKKRDTSQEDLRSAVKERRERDSNPRGGFPPTRFQVARIRPLCHPSGTDSVAR